MSDEKSWNAGSVQLILNAFNGVEVKALSATTQNFDKLCLRGARFVHKNTVVLGFGPGFSKGKLQRHPLQLCASTFVAAVWERNKYECDG